jgi:hypothetical protein
MRCVRMNEDMTFRSSNDPQRGARGVSAVSAVEQLDAGERRGWLREPRDSLSGGRTMTREFSGAKAAENQESNR